jgi:hypothetical protein
MRRTIQTASLFTIIALAGAMSACGKKEEKAGDPATATSSAKAGEAAPDPDTGMKPGSCDYRTDTGVCTYAKESSADMCKTMGGKPIDGPCPTDGVLGTCASPDSLTGEVKSYYPTSAAQYTAATAKDACEAQQGVWTPTGGAAGAATAAAPTVGACTVEADKSCSETKLNNPDDSATYGKQCAEISKGTWADGPCPMDGVIGECNSAAAGRTVYYKGAKDPKHTCEQMVMGGVYTAAAM